MADMTTIRQQMIGNVLARLVERRHLRHPTRLPSSYYIVSSYVDYPQLVAIGLCPAYDEQEASRLFDQQCYCAQQVGIGQ